MDNGIIMAAKKTVPKKKVPSKKKSTVQKKAAATKVDSLLQTIKQTAPSDAPEPETTSPTPGPAESAAPTQSKTGRFSSVYLNPEDQRLIRELSVWFAAQGLRINDTLVIRSALRAAHPGSELLAGYEESQKGDRRYKHNKSN